MFDTGENRRKVHCMPSEALGNITADISQATSVNRSATQLINGIAGRIDAAVQAALAKGATEAELQPVSALADELEASSKELSDAVVANTPTPPDGGGGDPGPQPAEIRARALRGGRGR